MEELKAKTSSGIPFYNKIDYEFLNRMAAALTAGSERYDPHVLVENWRLGDVKFYHDRANHGLEHIYRWLDGDRSEDHLAHAACNIMMLMWGEEQEIYNPASPEIRLLQYINFVRSNQEKRAQVDPQPELSTKETPTKEESQRNNNEQYDDINLDDIVPSDLVSDVDISHVDITGKPVFIPDIDIDKLKKKLLG